MTSQHTITEALAELRSGDGQAADRLVSLVYDELRRLAGQYLSAENPGHTLQPTALVHEAYLSLVKEPETNWQNRVHFFAVASRAMRRILVDHARSRRALKRGGDRHKVSLDEARSMALEPEEYLLAMDEALEKLAALDSQQSRIIELRFFGGLTLEETASLLGISVKTVQRDWLMARGWLHREVTKGD
jgi:RNA polymerase sigma factor (TIGR02999 family)